ncbi:MAG: GyrI-like domain-containing protein [Dehalococcoidia bacterium]|nr:MAG: GyrI-like domain-containing protein [Dehalococcoidia bacterium]
MAQRKSSKKEPQILEMPPQKMAVVHGKGTPDKVFSELMPALYGSVYTLKFALKKKGLPTFKVSGLRARYPDAHLVPKEEWTHIIALPIPEDTTSIPQKTPGIEVNIETWDYGTVAQILHVGSYAEEGPTIERLHQFIEENGYQVAGDHEEEYLTTPDAKNPKTIIRYQVKKK